MRLGAALVFLSTLLLSCGGNSPTCASYCAHARSGGCTDPALTCEVGCTTDSNDAATRCKSAFESWLRCAAGAPIVCDSFGKPGTPSCAAQQTALRACLAPAPADGGTNDGGTECLPDPSPDLAQTYCGALPATPRLRDCPAGSPSPDCVPTNTAGLFCCPAS